MTTTVTIQLVCTNDTHSQMDPFTMPSCGGSCGGVTRRATLLSKLRAEMPGSTLVLDAGDHFTGSNYFDVFQGEAEMAVLQQLGYDAAAFGNHDFDARKDGLRGVARFKAVQRRAPGVQFLCANLRDAATKELVFPPRAIFTLGNGVRVGVTSLLGPNAWDVTPVGLRKGLEMEPFLRVAETEAAALRDAGCDVLVCLSHTGWDRGDAELGERCLFDVVFSGHSHFFSPKETWHRCRKGSKKDDDQRRCGFVSQGLARGAGVAVAKLTLTRAGEESRWRCRASDAALDAIVVAPGLTETPSIVASLTTFRRGFEAAYAKVIGRCAADLTVPDRTHVASFFRFSAHVAVAEALRAAVPPRLAALQPSSAGSDANKKQPPPIVILNALCVGPRVPPPKRGPVRLGQVRELLPFPNVVVAVELSGRFLAALVRRNADFVSRADYLVLHGLKHDVKIRVTDAAADADGAAASTTTVRPIPSSLTSSAAQEDPTLSFVCSPATVVATGKPLETEAWYPCLVTDYVIDTLLADLPERLTGCRKRRVLEDVTAAQLVADFLQGGGVLGAPARPMPPPVPVPPAPARPLKLLIVSKGFGGGREGAKWAYLSSRPALFTLVMPEVPEFNSHEGNKDKGLRVLRHALAAGDVDVLVASSRGGQYAAALVDAGDWAGPTFLISAFSTTALCNAKGGTMPLTIAHGTRDKTNGIASVRRDVGLSSVAFLREFEDGHSLESLTASGAFAPMLLDLHRRATNDNDRRAWVVEQRPPWFEKEVAPRIAEDQGIAADAMAAARTAHRARFAMLSELKKGKAGKASRRPARTGGAPARRREA